jgi:hypothetical protein
MPQQLHTAYNTTFIPAGNLAAITTTTYRYYIKGNWHIGQLHDTINKHIARPVPNAMPFWTANGLIY